jgi:hypothetical protein
LVVLEGSYGIILTKQITFDGRLPEIVFRLGQRDGSVRILLSIFIELHLHLLSDIGPEGELRLPRGIDTFVFQACLLGGTGQ